MKISAILFSVLCAGMASYGKNVDELTAKKAGANYLMAQQVKGISSAADLSTSYIATAKVAGTTINDYYVFNVNGSGDFVMVAGDDIIRPILAYSATSAFDYAHLSASTKSWIEGYQNQITAAIANNLPASAATKAMWATLQTNSSSQTAARTTAGSGTILVTTQWDQYPYYNEYCPTDAAASAYGGTDVTGCVATAMAQIMKFWNWPTVGCGYHAYTDGTYGTLSANFGTTAYQWTSMPNSVSRSSSTVQKNAVATLMYHCGVSVNMTYTADESGAYTIQLESPIVNCAQFAFKNYFHYKPSLKGVARFGEYYGGTTYVDSMSTAAWIAMLQGELTAGRPMLYSGNGAAGGHAWVCDGWETSSSMFHFNWGWSGESDGWYTVDNLAPPALGVGGGGGNFNQDQCVIMGIMPDSFASNPGTIELSAPLNCTTNNPMGYGGPISIATEFKNSGSTSFTGDFCAQVFDTGNVLIGTIKTYTSQTIPAGDSTSLTFSAPAMYAMIPETYFSIRMMYRPSGTTAWTPVANNGTNINYSSMAVLNDTDMVLNDDIAASPAVPRQGRPLTVTVQIADEQGAANFSGNVRAILINIATGAVDTIQTLTHQALNNGYYNTFTFTTSSVTAVPGNYVLEIQHQYYAVGNWYTTGNLYYENPVLITVTSPVDVPNVAAANNISIYPNPAKDMINISFGGTQVSEITISDIQGHQIQKQQVDNSLTSISIPTANFAAGVYFIQLKVHDDVIAKKIVITR